MQQEKIEGLWEGGQNGGKADWKNERSLSSFLKHSCFLCWSSPRETDAVETDERVITKAAEIRVRRPQHLALVCVSLCVMLGFNCVCACFAFWLLIEFGKDINQINAASVWNKPHFP